MDCLTAMREMPDDAFDLAVVDPPYGSGLTDGGGCIGWFTKYRDDAPVYWNRFGERFDKYKNTPHGEESGNAITWDVAPPPEYFEQLFRVSKNQIIWGGNYYQLPPTRCFLIWRKTNIPEKFSMAMVEYAWTSFNTNAKVYECSSMNQEGRFHPTQKPIELYRWVYMNYAPKGCSIIDTHLGSGSSRIAAYEMGLDFAGYEIDQEYFNKQEERFNAYTAQISLFESEGLS